MKKALCICLIIAAVFLVAGGVCMAVGFFRYGGLPTGGGEYTEVEKTFSAGLTEIRTDLKIHDVQVIKGEGESVRLRYFNENGKALDAAVSDGVLTVSDPNTRNWSFPWNWFGDREDRLRVTVELPGDFSGSLTIATETGRIEVRGVELDGETLSVQGKTGDVQITDCAFASVAVRLTTGGTNLENVTVGARAGTTGSLRIAAETGKISCRNVTAKDTELSASTGKTETEDLSCTSFSSVTSTGEQSHTRLTVSGDAEIRVTTGDVETDTLTAGGALRITSTTGSQSLHGIRAGASIWLEATTGSIRGSLRGTENYYAKDCSSGTGNVRLPQFAAGGTVPLTARTSTGSIRLDAAD